MNRYKFDKENHVHLLDERPLIGTTTALGVLGKNLTWWAAELAAVTALESGTHIPTIRDEYNQACESGDKKKGIDALQKKYPIFKKARFAHYETKNEKADAGTDLHSELENYIKLMISDQDGVPHLMNGYNHKAVEIFATWAKENVKRFLVSEGHAYNEKLWVGGILDLLYEDNEGKLAIMDFKSAKEAYMSHFLQCAGNDLQISDSGVLDSNGNLILKPERSVEYYGVFPFGAKNPEPKFYYDTTKAKRGFEATVELHKIINI